MAPGPKEKGTAGSVVTIFDIAKDVGVHASTVSRALDPEQQDRVKESTRIKILEAVDRLGYRPDLVARGLRRGRTATIGVIVADLGSTYIHPIIHGLTAAVDAEGMLPMIAETNESQDRLKLIIDHMLGRRVDAIVVAAARRGDRTILEKAAITVPLLIAARPLSGTKLPQVVHDELLGGRQVADYFHELGHTEALQLLGPGDVANFERRRRGFSSQWSRHGRRELPHPKAGRQATIAEGRRMMNEVIGNGEKLPTAIFAGSDFLAIGALSVLHEAGINVPGAVSLVGYNDLPTVEHLTPALTTVRTMTYDLGYQAGMAVQDLLHNRPVKNVVIEPTLIRRQSTGPPVAD